MPGKANPTVKPVSNHSIAMRKFKVAVSVMMMKAQILRKFGTRADVRYNHIAMFAQS